MPASNFTRLQSLSDREYRNLSTSKPEQVEGPRSFKPRKLSLDRYDRRWDRKRGSAIRLTGVLLRDTEEAMQQRVCASSATKKTYSSAAGWLTSEAELLRKTAKMHEMAVARLTTVLARCNGEATAS